jgi:rare lipoprotein A (peptidoglycan hydrolase)
MKRLVQSLTVIFTVLLLAGMISLPALPAAAQEQPESYISRVERARSLERDIAALEQQLVKAQQDWITTSQRLQEVEKGIVDCYSRIDATEAQVENAKRGLNEKLRLLYIEGRRDALVKLLGSNDVSDFVTKLDYLLRFASGDAGAFGELKAKRNRLRKYQDQLIAFKQEEAKLSKNDNAAAIESMLAQKKDQLAEVNGSIIADQLPAAQTAAPTDFSPTRVYEEPDEDGFVHTGQTLSGYSTWYGNEFNGRPTASGEIFDQYAFTCAHKTLPFGTWLRVTFKGRSVVVRVNDRGPFVKGRMLDLSRGSAEVIGLTGVQWVDCEIVVPK